MIQRFWRPTHLQRWFLSGCAIHFPFRFHDVRWSKKTAVGVLLLKIPCFFPCWTEGRTASDGDDDDNDDDDDDDDDDGDDDDDDDDGDGDDCS